MRVFVSFSARKVMIVGFVWLLILVKLGRKCALDNTDDRGRVLALILGKEKFRLHLLLLLLLLTSLVTVLVALGILLLLGF